ncbi:MAG: hypothetical protein ACK56I_02915, partial [bacterium]
RAVPAPEGREEPGRLGERQRAVPALHSLEGEREREERVGLRGAGGGAPPAAGEDVEQLCRPGADDLGVEEGGQPAVQAGGGEARAAGFAGGGLGHRDTPSVARWTSSALAPVNARSSPMT